MKVLIALAATALTLCTLVATSSAATGSQPSGRWGIVQPTPRSWGIVRPNAKVGNIRLPARSSTQTTESMGLRPLAAIGRW